MVVSNDPNQLSSQNTVYTPRSEALDGQINGSTDHAESIAGSQCGVDPGSANYASLASHNGVYMASCNRNGVQITTPVTPNGGVLNKRNDDSWNGTSAPLGC